MPVESHEVHPSTRIGAEYRYGCFNRPRPTAETIYLAPNGLMIERLSNEGFDALTHLTPIKYVFSTECRFDMSLTDPACNGCEWRGSGERYNEQVRKDGK